MPSSFSLHCIPWHARAQTLMEVRSAAVEMGLLSQVEARTDSVDEQSSHALVLSEIGTPLGCARITPEGKAERMTVLPHEDRIEIESALKLAAMLIRASHAQIQH